MLRRSTPLLALSLLAAGAVPAQAGGPTLVRMLDVRFEPKVVTIPVGSSVTWRNDGDLPHTSTSLKRYPTAWDRSLSSDESWTKRFAYAGTYPYFCDLHSNGTDGMAGKLRLPVRVTPASGGTGTGFTITLASEAPPSGWSFEVQRKIGNGEWTTIRNSVARTSVGYRSSTRGTHRFRVRLERANPPLSHAFSPVDVITIS